MTMGNESLISRQVLGYVKKLSLGDHAILLYESLAIKHRVLFTFLREGLEKGDASIYVAAEETPEQIRRGMKGFGIDVEKYKLEDSLKVLNYDPLYMRGEVVNPIPEIMENWSKEIQHIALWKKGNKDCKRSRLQVSRTFPHSRDSRI